VPVCKNGGVRASCSIERQILVAAVFLSGAVNPVLCQDKPEDRAVKLALDGRCGEAMSALKQLAFDTLGRETKRMVGKAGVRCAMLLNQQNEATSYLDRLQHEFPSDPDILFLAVHVYSDLAQSSAQSLMNSAPGSQEVIQLNAENFEKQGDLKKAIAEYRVLLQRVPSMPGIHYRIGGLIMAQLASATSSEEARKEFEAELKIFPQNAGAEYYLGELARQSDKLADAIVHFKRSAELYPSFAEAHYGLGRSLLDSGKAADAVAPLEAAVKLAPENPTGHFALATAYQRTGRTEDAAREFALQKSTSEKLNQNTKTLRKNVSGAPTDKK